MKKKITLLVLGIGYMHALDGFEVSNYQELFDASANAAAFWELPDTISPQALSVVTIVPETSGKKRGTSQKIEVSEQLGKRCKAIVDYNVSQAIDTSASDEVVATEKQYKTCSCQYCVQTVIDIPRAKMQHNFMFHREKVAYVRCPQCTREFLDTERVDQAPLKTHKENHTKLKKCLKCDRFFHLQSKETLYHAIEHIRQTQPILDASTLQRLAEQIKKENKIKLAAKRVQVKTFCIAGCCDAIADLVERVEHTLLLHATSVNFYGCSMCKRRFATIQNRDNHQEKHGLPGRLFKCDVKGCNWWFAEYPPKYYEGHLNAHKLESILIDQADVALSSSEQSDLAEL